MTSHLPLPPVSDADVDEARENMLRAWGHSRISVRKEDCLRVVLDAYRARLIAAGHATEPTTPAPPLVLPTVDEIAPVIWADIKGDALAEEWARIGETGQRYWRKAAACVLDLLESRVPHWERIEPGEIVAGMRVHFTGTHGDDGSFNVEGVNGGRFYWANGYSWAGSNDRTWYVDPRTIPADPADPALAVVIDYLDPDNWDESDARDLLARIDAARADQ